MTSKIHNKHGLRERAILVQVNTSLFGTQKKDRDATEDAAVRYGAEKTQVAVTKSILNRKNPAFDRIVKIKGLIRNAHLATTGVWDDSYRIISTKRYGQWRETMDEFRQDFDAAVEDLIKVLPDIKAEAQQNLGQLYDPSLIPDADTLRCEFSVDIKVEVLPERGHIALDLDAEHLARITEEAGAADNSRLERLTRETHERVRDELEKMSEALREFGNDLPNTKRTRTFRDSLVKRMAGMSDILPGLNVTGDPKLDKLSRAIAAKLTVVDAAELRGDKKPGDKRSKEQRDADASKKREEIADAADSLLADLGNVFGASADKAA